MRQISAVYMFVREWISHKEHLEYCNIGFPTGAAPRNAGFLTGAAPRNTGFLTGAAPRNTGFLTGAAPRNTGFLTGAARRIRIRRYIDRCSPT